LHVPLGSVWWIQAIHHFSNVAPTRISHQSALYVQWEKRQLKWHAKTRGEKSLTLRTGKHKKKQLEMTSVLCFVHEIMALTALQKHDDTPACSIFPVFKQNKQTNSMV
jgi:hypothetical protein